MFDTIIQKLNKDNKAIYRIIMQKGPLTKNKIIEITGMSLTTLNRTLNALSKHQLIEEAGVDRSSGGRKPAMFQVSSDTFYFVGIDVSRTYSKMVICNSKIETMAQFAYTMTSDMTPQRLVSLFHVDYLSALSDLGIEETQIGGIGIGAVGPLDREQGILLETDRFPTEDWRNINLKSIVSSAFEIDCVVDNGANTAVLLEYLMTNDNPDDNTAYINCGIGIRNGLISSGKIVRSLKNVSDALGHMVIQLDGLPCTCGKSGCLESYASITALEHKVLIETGQKLTFQEILSEAKEGKEPQRSIVLDASRFFGTALANFINLLSPRRIILSGPVIHHSQLFYEEAIKTAVLQLPAYTNDDISFIKEGSFGSNAIASGAALLFIESVMASEII